MGRSAQHFFLPAGLSIVGFVSSGDENRLLFSIRFEKKLQETMLMRSKFLWKVGHQTRQVSS
jgi:hypothetical protein